MLHDRVMVAPARDEGERRSTGGIVIPATATVSKRLVWGEVCGAGHHVRTVAVGDRVLYAPDDNFEIEVEGRSYVVLRERDLHAMASEVESDRPTSGTGLYL